MSVSGLEKLRSVVSPFVLAHNLMAPQRIGMEVAPSGSSIHYSRLHPGQGLRFP